MQNLLAKIDANGFVEENNFFSVQDIEQVRKWLYQNRPFYSEESFTIRDSGGLVAMTSTPMADLVEKYQLIDRLRALAEIKLRRKISTRETLIVLRCLAGRDGGKHSHRFHYDSYAVTALIPVEIPSSNTFSGGLVIIPNLRPQKRGQLFNALEKVLIQNKLSSLLIRWLINKDLIKSKKIKLKENNIYIFDGYRSLHASDSYPPDERRVTMMIHIGLPGNNGLVDRLTNGLKNRVRAMR